MSNKKVHVNKKTDMEALKKAQENKKPLAKKRQKRKFYKYQKQYETFIAYADQVGIMNVNIRDYGEKTAIPHQRVSEWRKYYLEDYKIHNDLTDTELLAQGKAVLARLAALSFNENPKISANASKSFIDCSERFITIMERLGFKDSTVSHDQGVFLFKVNTGEGFSYPEVDYGDVVEVEK